MRLPALLAVVLGGGCGGDKQTTTATTTPPAKDAGVVAVAPQVVADARLAADATASAASPVITPVDPETLPAWEVPKVAGNGPTVELFTVDMDGDQLLGRFAPAPWIALAGKPTVTGRLSAPSRQAAAAALAAQLGAELQPTPLRGRGVTVDIEFSDAPGVDLVRLLGDVGHVNVIAPGELPTFDVVVHRAPWDALLAVIAKLAAREVTRVGNTSYLLPTGTTLPALPKVPSSPRLTLDVHDGTIAHAIAALRGVAAVPLEACTSPPFTLQLRNVTLAEALRALSIASGVELTEGSTCKTATLGGAPPDELRLTAIAEIGVKRAAAFDRKGEVVTATRDGTIVTELGSGYVTIGGTTLVLYPHREVDADPGAEVDATAFAGKLRRTAALMRTGDAWTAYVQTTTGGMWIDPKRPFGLPLGAAVSVDARGVHLELDPVTKVELPLAR